MRQVSSSEHLRLLVDFVVVHVRGKLDSVEIFEVFDFFNRFQAIYIADVFLLKDHRREAIWEPRIGDRTVLEFYPVLSP